MRADALRNRTEIVRAARELFLEFGPDVPLDRIAERAGVGNATLYRRFPTRDDLIEQVVIDNMAQVGELADAAATDTDAWQGFCTFTHAMVERRCAALLPILGQVVPKGPDFEKARAALISTLTALLRRTRKHGGLRSDVTVAELILMLATITRPLPAVSAELTAAVQRRHLALLLDGLRTPAPSALPGRAIEVDEIARSLGAPSGSRS